MFLVFDMYKGRERYTHTERVCMCSWYIIKCRNSDPIFTRYVSQIPSLTYELTKFYYTELLRVLDLSICVGSSRREGEREREVEIPKVR